MIEPMPIWIAVDIGCIECGESSDLIGVYNTEESAEIACKAAEAEHERDWHGQHHFEVYRWPKLEVAPDPEPEARPKAKRTVRPRFYPSTVGAGTPPKP